MVFVEAYDPEEWVQDGDEAEKYGRRAFGAAGERDVSEVGRPRMFRFVLFCFGSFPAFAFTRSGARMGSTLVAVSFKLTNVFGHRDLDVAR